MSKKKIIFIVLLLVAFIILPFVMRSYDNKKIDNKKAAEKASQLQLQKEREKPIYLSDKELDDQAINTFLTDLMGDDHQMLPLVIDAEEIQRYIDENKINENEQMSAELTPKWVKEMGEKIKDKKRLVESRVTDIKRGPSITQYLITLLFFDNTKKVLEIDVREGKIITSINDLIE